MGRRKSGGFEGILIVVAAIVGLIITAVQYLWPILLAMVVLGVALYFLKNYIEKKQKEKAIRDEKIANITNHLETLEKYYNDAKASLASNQNQPFVQSLFDQLPFEMNIAKANIGMIDGSMTEEEAQSQIDSARKAIDDYKLVVDVDKSYDGSFNTLNKLFSSIKLVRWINQIPTSKYIYSWDNNIVRLPAKFSKKYFNKVVLPDSRDVYAITCKQITYYFYPDCIVESKSKYDFKVLKYSKVTFMKVMADVEEELMGLPGAKLKGITYLHTKANGGPDLRYSDNPQFRIYEYYYLYSKMLSNFVVEIGDEALANGIYETLFNLAQGTKSVADDVMKVDEQENVEFNNEKNVDEVDRDEVVAYDDTQIVETMKSIFDSFGKDVVLEKRFVYMLDDYLVFNDVAYFKNILKLVQGEVVLNELIEQDSWNNKCMAIVASLSQKYMLQEEALERVLKDIVLAIN